MDNIVDLFNKKLVAELRSRINNLYYGRNDYAILAGRVGVLSNQPTELEMLDKIDVDLKALNLDFGSLNESLGKARFERDAALSEIKKLEEKSNDDRSRLTSIFDRLNIRKPSSIDRAFNALACGDYEVDLIVKTFSSLKIERDEALSKVDELAKENSKLKEVVDELTGEKRKQDRFRIRKKEDKKDKKRLKKMKKLMPIGTTFYFADEKFVVNRYAKYLFLAVGHESKTVEHFELDQIPCFTNIVKPKNTP